MKKEIITILLIDMLLLVCTYRSLTAKEIEKEMVIKGYLYAYPSKSIEKLRKTSIASAGDPIVDMIFHGMGYHRFVIKGKLGEKLKFLCPGYNNRYNIHKVRGNVTLSSNTIVKIKGMVRLKNFSGRKGRKNITLDKVGKGLGLGGRAEYELENGKLLEIEFLPPVDKYKNVNVNPRKLSQSLKNLFPEGVNFSKLRKIKKTREKNINEVKKSIKILEEDITKLNSFKEKLSIKVDVSEDKILYLKKINLNVIIKTVYIPEHISQLIEGYQKVLETKRKMLKQIQR